MTNQRIKKPASDEASGLNTSRPGVSRIDGGDAEECLHGSALLVVGALTGMIGGGALGLGQFGPDLQVIVRAHVLARDLLLGRQLDEPRVRRARIALVLALVVYRDPLPDLGVVLDVGTKLLHPLPKLGDREGVGPC
jgi:hypothetical protein